MSLVSGTMQAPRMHFVASVQSQPSLDDGDFDVVEH
jgi:hypothetical protein